MTEGVFLRGWGSAPSRQSGRRVSPRRLSGPALFVLLAVFLSLLAAWAPARARAGASVGKAGAPAPGPQLTFPPATPPPLLQLPPELPDPLEPQPPTRSSPPVPDLMPYTGLGAWVDVYDYGQPEDPRPEAIIDEMARRGVRTLYLQTSRWTSPSDMTYPQAVGPMLDLAHSRGLKVVGWYLLGLGNIERDVRRSRAVLDFVSPSGGRFNGFAADIEEHAEVRNDRSQFNAGIVRYSEQLRAAVPPDTVLGAIVPDAKNNERAPAHWDGFPWPEIGRYYDVIMPMAYWSVTKSKNLDRCRSTQMDAAAYMREVIEKTERLMGVGKPFHPAGGIADCGTPEEVSGYVNALRERGCLGGSLYDFMTTNAHPQRERMWEALSRVNH